MSDPSIMTEGEGERVDPRLIRVLRIRAAIVATVLLVAAIVAEVLVDGWTGVFAAPVILLAIVWVGILPRRRWAVRSFTMRTDELRAVHGLVTRWDNTVPFGRVQHLDVTRGALERANGIATLVLHTAGSGVSSIAVEGLDLERAEAMRDYIRDIVKANTR